jgi:uncharacterized protein with HEPN domain
MLDAIDKIQHYASIFTNPDELNNDVKSFDAILMNFIVIGEMVEKLSIEFREESDEEINWTKISGFRNIIAHNYFGIDAEEVWQIIKHNLPMLERNLRVLIE